jgi:hypothetical protein
MPTSDVLIYWIYMSCLHAENFQGGYFLLQLAITNDVFASCTNQHIKKRERRVPRTERKETYAGVGFCFCSSMG